MWTTESTNHISLTNKKAGLDVMQCHPLYRIHFGQYQASSAALGRIKTSIYVLHCTVVSSVNIAMYKYDSYYFSKTIINHLLRLLWKVHLLDGNLRRKDNTMEWKYQLMWCHVTRMRGSHVTRMRGSCDQDKGVMWPGWGSHVTRIRSHVTRMGGHVTRMRGHVTRLEKSCDIMWSLYLLSRCHFHCSIHCARCTMWGWSNAQVIHAVPPSSTWTQRGWWRPENMANQLQ